MKHQQREDVANNWRAKRRINKYLVGYVIDCPTIIIFRQSWVIRVHRRRAAARKSAKETADRFQFFRKITIIQPGRRLCNEVRGYLNNVTRSPVRSFIRSANSETLDPDEVDAANP